MLLLRKPPVDPARQHRCQTNACRAVSDGTRLEGHLAQLRGQRNSWPFLLPVAALISLDVPVQTDVGVAKTDPDTGHDVFFM